MTADTEKWIKRFTGMPKIQAIAEIQYRRDNSLDPTFWNGIESEVTAYFQRKEESDRAAEQYYVDKLSLAEREFIHEWVDTNKHDLRTAYQTVNAAIKNARTDEIRIFWKYALRILNRTPRVAK